MSLLSMIHPKYREIADVAPFFSGHYFFDSSKFTEKYNWEATPIMEAIKQVVHHKKTALYY